MPDFAIQGIDRIEIIAWDSLVVAEWYERVLGFETILESGTGSQAREVFVSNKKKTVVLVIRDGNVHEAGNVHEDGNILEAGNIDRIVFKTSGAGFVDFVKHLDELDLFCMDIKVTKEDIVDYRNAYSLYFEDPDGNKLALSSYDYDYITVALK